MGKYQKTRSKSKKGIGSSVFAVLLSLGLLGSCFNGGEPETSATKPVESSISTEETTYATTEPVVTIIESTVQETDSVIEETSEEIPEPEPITFTYILNTNSMKFHYSSCSGAAKIKDSNKGTFTGTREEIIAKGYDSCGICTP